MRNYVLVLGRVLFALIFLVSGLKHLTGDADAAAAAAGVPLATIAVPLAGAISLAGALSIIVGFHARIGGWLIVLFLVPVTFYMHAFWNAPDPAAHQMQLVNFMKNVSLIGAALMIAASGVGPMSLDARRGI